MLRVPLAAMDGNKSRETQSGGKILRGAPDVERQKLAAVPTIAKKSCPESEGSRRKGGGESEGTGLPAAPVCECGESAKMTSATRPSGETKHFWLCSQDKACDFFMPCAAPASAAAHVSCAEEDTKGESGSGPAAGSAGLGLGTQNAPTAKEKQGAKSRGGAEDDELGAALSKLSIGGTTKQEEHREGSASRSGNHSKVVGRTASPPTGGEDRRSALLIDDDDLDCYRTEDPHSNKGARKSNGTTSNTRPGMDHEMVKEVHGVMYRDAKASSFKAPEGLQTALMPHQVASVSWMVERESGGGALGGVLADDMGLGKTVQVIALVLKNATSRPEKHSRCTVVVCPKSTQPQWLAEVARLAPGLKLCDYSGPGRNRGGPEALEECDVLVVSYAVVTREHSEGAQGEWEAQGLMACRFRRVVLDEGHTVSNVNSKGFAAVCGLRAKRRWVVTGTPVQNKTQDMLAYFRFIGVAPFDDAKVFRRVFLEDEEKGVQRMQAVANAMVMRRTKQAVFGDEAEAGRATLPSKTVKVVMVALSEEERTLSCGFEALSRHWVLTNAGRKRCSAAAGTYTELLTLLLRAQQACNNPGLIPEESKARALGPVQAKPGVQDVKSEIASGEEGGAGEEGLDDLAASLASISLAVGGVEVEGVSGGSSKLKMMVEDVQEMLRDAPQDKCVVFSQWTQQLNAAGSALQAAGVKYVRLDGDMQTSKRQESIDAFQNDDETPVFLISLKAGGAGLNLTRGNRVFMLDPWWNPAVENQAFDRVHRMGQTKEVLVTRYIAADSVEQRILMLQDRKQKIASSLLANSNRGQVGGRLTLKDLLMLLP